MGFRVVLIESNVGIHLKLNNLVINTENRDIWIPIEDISILILDNTKITLNASDIIFFIYIPPINILFIYFITLCPIVNKNKRLSFNNLLFIKLFIMLFALQFRFQHFSVLF
mgnify:CR=1 FL=1